MCCPHLRIASSNNRRTLSPRRSPCTCWPEMYAALVMGRMIGNVRGFVNLNHLNFKQKFSAEREFCELGHAINAVIHFPLSTLLVISIDNCNIKSNYPFHATTGRASPGNAIHHNSRGRGRARFWQPNIGPKNAPCSCL